MEDPGNVGVTGCRWLLESQNLDSRPVMDKSPRMCELLGKTAPWEAWIPRISRSGWSPSGTTLGDEFASPLIIIRDVKDSGCWKRGSDWWGGSYGADFLCRSGLSFRRRDTRIGFRRTPRSILLSHSLL